MTEVANAAAGNNDAIAGFGVGKGSMDNPLAVAGPARLSR